ncbi:hypothetical protein [Coprobacter secundus]|uniref:hypothetical protein n=1 Tax=Coprobacter secundus TaxID=1501392 RepID=UPI0022E55197|nr:hypothetical protein [Coprobacter secundus]
MKQQVVKVVVAKKLDPQCPKSDYFAKLPHVKVHLRYDAFCSYVPFDFSPAFDVRALKSYDKPMLSCAFWRTKRVLYVIVKPEFTYFPADKDVLVAFGCKNVISKI